MICFFCDFLISKYFMELGVKLILDCDIIGCVSFVFFVYIKCNIWKNSVVLSVVDNVYEFI